MPQYGLYLLCASPPPCLEREDGPEEIWHFLAVCDSSGVIRLPRQPAGLLLPDRVRLYVCVYKTDGPCSVFVFYCFEFSKWDTHGQITGQEKINDQLEASPQLPPSLSSVYETKVGKWDWQRKEEKGKMKNRETMRSRVYWMCVERGVKRSCVCGYVCEALTLPLCVAELRWEVWWEVDCVWRASGYAVDREHELCNGRQQSPHTHQRRENLHAWTGTGCRRYPAHAKTSNAAHPGVISLLIPGPILCISPH